MKFPKGHKCHECAPQEWRRTPDITGSYELDAVIRNNSNKDIPHRLAYYCESVDDSISNRRTEAYGPRTGYNGYHGYSGDD